MRLYICWGLFRTPRPGHPCRNAHEALRTAGHDPQVVRCYGWGLLPSWLNQTQGRREVRRLTGKDWVPVLVTREGEVVAGSDRIRRWADQHAASEPDKANPIQSDRASLLKLR